jgi:hypothetical protein
MVRPSKSNSRHLIRRTCFNLPKLSSITGAQSSSSSLNPTHQQNSPTSQSHPFIDTSPSTPLTNRKTNLHDHLVFSTSQSKEAPSRGISPRINRNTATTNIYNPSSIERI